MCILDTNPLLVKSWLVLFNVNIALHPAETSNSTILAIFSSVEDGFFLLQKCLPWRSKASSEVLAQGSSHVENRVCASSAARIPPLPPV